MKQVPQPESEISVICCYRDAEQWKKLSSSAKSLSALDIEFVGIDNSSNRYTLPEAYNKGRYESKGRILFFLHDDVSFLLENWDLHLKSAFESLPSCGVLGFAGGAKAFSAPSTWWTKAGKNEVYRSMVRRTEKGGFKVHQDASSAVEVIGLDGFALAVKRELLEDFVWSNNIGKWHGYDLDLCYHVYFNQNRRNYVIPHVILRHLSLGSTNRDWAQSMINIWLKYYEKLEVQSSKSDNYEALSIFINWTHQDYLFADLKRVADIAKVDSLFVVLMRLCYSRTQVLKRLGFRLLDYYEKLIGS